MMTYKSRILHYGAMTTVWCRMGLRLPDASARGIASSRNARVVLPAGNSKGTAIARKPRRWPHVTHNDQQQTSRNSHAQTHRPDLRALLAAEKADALSAMSASKLSEERAAALDYYLGDMSRDMPAPDGRSRAVSTDVSDTVEGLMPSLMDIFTAGDEVVRFEPVGPEDVQGAEQETDYVNHVFMQQNPGFLVLYSFIKDALLSKVGVVKVWWETRESTSAKPISISPRMPSR